MTSESGDLETSLITVFADRSRSDPMFSSPKRLLPERECTTFLKAGLADIPYSTGKAKVKKEKKALAAR